MGMTSKYLHNVTYKGGKAFVIIVLKYNFNYTIYKLIISSYLSSPMLSVLLLQTHVTAAAEGDSRPVRSPASPGVRDDPEGQTHTETLPLQM